jgi:D-alanyl-D-alanine carboxypeptidase
MSLETALQRVAALQAWTAAPAPAPVAQPAAPAATSFEATLASAMGTTAPAATARPAPTGTYPHLTGDLDANPELLARLERLAAARGETWEVTSGLRTTAEQQRLWDNRASNPFPVARPGTSRHEHGNAADVTIGGRPIQDVVPRDELVRAGISPLAGDAVHVELP